MGQQTSPPLKGLRILLVDDEQELREIFAEELLFLGAEVSTASRTCEALALLRKGPGVDVILSDLRMPEGGGLSLIKTIRAEMGAESPLFVLMTGFMEMAPERAEAEGIAQIFEKPLDWDALTTYLLSQKLSGKSSGKS